MQTHNFCLFSKRLPTPSLKLILNSISKVYSPLLSNGIYQIIKENHRLSQSQHLWILTWHSKQKIRRRKDSTENCKYLFINFRAVKLHPKQMIKTRKVAKILPKNNKNQSNLIHKLWGNKNNLKLSPNNKDSIVFQKTPRRLFHWNLLKANLHNFCKSKNLKISSKQSHKELCK